MFKPAPGVLGCDGLEPGPDGRLIDHCQRWQLQSGQAVSVATLHRARRALDWTHKKKAHRQ